MLFEGSQPLLFSQGVLHQHLDDSQSFHDVRNVDLFFHLLVLAGVDPLSSVDFEASTALVDAGARYSNLSIEP